MPEINLTGPNPLVFPELTTWGWQVALYLFLGGLVAGLMVLGGVTRLMGKPGWERAQWVSDIFAAPLLVIGLLALVLDLANPFNAWRLFTAFEPTSAISWGSWILLIGLILLGLRFLTRLPAAPVSAPRPVAQPLGIVYRPPALAQRAATGVWRLLNKLGAFAEERRRPLAIIQVVLGVAVGFYTGVLLSTIPARPLWNSAVLAPLFLVSGLATGAAFACLFLPKHEHERLAPLSLLFCGIELVLILAYAINLTFGMAGAQGAAHLLFTGRYGVLFWGLVVLVGLVAPGTIEAFAVRGKELPGPLSRLPAVLKLTGGITLRFVIVAAGLLSAI